MYDNPGTSNDRIEPGMLSGNNHSPREPDGPGYWEVSGTARTVRTARRRARNKIEDELDVYIRRLEKYPVSSVYYSGYSLPDNDNTIYWPYARTIENNLEDGGKFKAVISGEKGCGKTVNL